MQFGLTTKQKHEVEQAEILAMIKGVRKFAFFPTKLHDGTYVWWKFYWAYFKGMRDFRGDYSLWSSSPEEFSPMSDNFLQRHGRQVRVSDYTKEEKGIYLLDTEEPTTPNKGW